MGARFVRFQRLLKFVLLAAAVVVGGWWLVHVPYDPQAIYRPIPYSASLVGRHRDLPARWDELLKNPLALALMRTAGVDPEDAAGLTADEESLAWFRKLAGREGTLAYLPGGVGRPPAWMAVSHLGGESQKLRWQLSLFRVPGYTRMTQFPGRPVWQVEVPGLAPDQALVIAFGEGVILACLSANPFAIAEVMGAADGTVQRLVDAESSFSRFAAGDDRSVPDRLWFRDPGPLASVDSPGIAVELPVVRGDAISLVASTEGADWVMGAHVPDPDASTGLSRLLGDGPCAVAVVQAAQLQRLQAWPELPRDARHVLRMITDVAAGEITVAFMDGDMGGRLTWGVMRTLGLSGLRVPTLVLATRSSEAAAAAAIQRVLDASNARYRAAFVLRPVSLPAGTIHVLESAGGNEWVDDLARSDRPAYAVVDGWLLASSNLAALQKLVERAAAADGGKAIPEWAGGQGSPSAVAVWLHLARGGQMARDAIATWSMAQMFMDGAGTEEIREQLNQVKTWIDAFVPFGTARAGLGRRLGKTVLEVELGLSGPGASDRMDSP